MKSHKSVQYQGFLTESPRKKPQDLIQDSYLEVMGCCLKRGLSRGQWTMFGDFSMQAIYTDGTTGPEMIEKLEDCTSFIRFRLTINCRNTKPICREIETVTGFKAPNDLWTKVDGPPVQYITWSTMEGQCKKLKALLKQLADAHINPEQITILSPRKRENSVVAMLDGYTIKDFKVPVGDTVGDDPGIVEEKKTNGESVEFLENAEELINRSNAYRQSAISLTVCANKDDTIRVEVSAGIYSTMTATDPKTEKKVTTYPRTAITWNNDGNPLALPTAEQRYLPVKVAASGLQFDITYRYSLGNNVIYTFTLENTKPKASETVKDDDCFFQVRFCLQSEKGFSPLSDGQRITEDEDYQSNQLLYRNVRNYAIGHGCAADWDDSEKVSWISTAVFPKYDIKPIVPSTIDGVSLEMYKMSPYGSFSETVSELHLMCEKYREWINGLRVVRNSLESVYRITADRHITNCETCLSRMEKGVELLEQNESVRIAFQYMNLAMLMQQLHYNLPLQHWVEDGKGDITLNDPVQIPDVKSPDTWYGDKSRYGKWRPFQLAFVLMNLKSMYDRDCSERDIVDLIWFPTGGGKTEAYLGLSAYTIFIRRLLDKSDNGTATSPVSSFLLLYHGSQQSAHYVKLRVQ